MTTVLVIDDDFMVVKLLETSLRGKGFDIIAGYDSQEAWQLIHSTKSPDMVVLDVNMPGVDGFELLGKIKSTESTQSLPVIMLTARKREEDKARAMKEGASAFITKPFVPEELLDVILDISVNITKSA